MEPADPSGLPRGFGSAECLDAATMAGAPLRSLPRPSRLRAALTTLDGVGPRLGQAAAEAGIETLDDLLERIPHSYRDLAEPTPIAELRIGQEATIAVAVRSVSVRRGGPRGRMAIVQAQVADASGPTTAVWFNQAWLADKLEAGSMLLLNGKLDRRGFTVKAHEVVGASGEEPPTGIHTTGLVPVHPAGEGLRAERVRGWVWRALALADDSVEALPASVRVEQGLGSRAAALRAVHFPSSAEQARVARHRLAFEELFLHQIALALRRRQRCDAQPGVELDPPGPTTRSWLDSLPFEPTRDQRRAFSEIDRDLGTGQPMQRLLMGEVGSGKTVVALYAMLRALESGYQAALMAPTETLAEQHAATLGVLLSAASLPCALLTGATASAARRRTLERLATGELGLVVGTHALIEPAVEFARLAMVVVDEQHRFGVSQRAAMDGKGPWLDSRRYAPHGLHMTATPIPRTLSLTAYGDLDATTLRQLPAGRRPVKTWVVGEERRPGAYGFIRDRLREGRQAFVVCPLVSESEKLQAKAAAVEAERLAAGELAEFSIELLHGQMSSTAKGDAMGRFASGQADVLVATSVIEVGIDVPNATVMVIEGADRYGLSQLHQLRGRVGRGREQSWCLLFAAPESDRARRRLEAIATESDGFKLAEIDLELRGEGELLGTKQSGLPRFKVADLPDDSELLAAARDQVIAIVNGPGLADPAYGPMLGEARRRFGDERAAAVPA